jgi:Ca2+/Na+ antiporter
MQPSPYIQKPLDSFNVRTLVAPAGAALAFLGFFMPWAYAGVFIVGRSFTGYELGVMWPIPFLCAGVVAAAFLPYMLRQTPFRMARALALVCACLGLLIMFLRLSRLTSEMQDMMLGSWSIQTGFFITLFGLILAVVGALLLPAPRR